MNFSYLKKYFLFELFIVTIICPMSIFSMSKEPKQSTEMSMDQISRDFFKAQQLLTKKQYDKEKSKQLINRILPYLKEMYSKSHDETIDLLLYFTVETLSFIADQDGNLDQALAYWYDPVFNKEVAIPQKFQLLFQHKADNANRTLQFNQIRIQLINMLRHDDGSELYYLPNRIYGMSLIADGNLKEGVQYLDKIPVEFAGDLSVLQLYIAYKFGYDDISTNIEKVKVYETNLKKRLQFLASGSDTPTEKSYYFIRGYIKLFGLLGEKKDIAEGLKLIDESENYVDDIYIPISELFPQLEQIREDYYIDLVAQKTAMQNKQNSIIDELLAEEEAKSKKSKTKQPAKQQGSPIPSKTKKEPIASSSSSGEPAFATQTFSPAEITPGNLNDTFVPLFGDKDDKSRVTNVDRANKTITINDPLRNEELIVHASHIPVHTFRDIGHLDYDKRIAERQKTGNIKTDYNHSFAHMLDYVIQYVGDLVPFLQMGKEPKTTLTVIVDRIDLTTKKKLRCIAELTFGKDFNAPHKRSFTIVYHRLLRPNTSRQI